MNNKNNQKSKTTRKDALDKSSSFSLPKKLLFVIIALIFLILVDTFITGFGKFAYNTIRCGRVPVEITPNGLYGGSAGYNFPGTEDYRVFATSTYYCTAEDAETHHVMPNSLSPEGRLRLEELRSGTVKNN